jgi:glycosyltransferase involved in cell wall biosynthesis
MTAVPLWSILVPTLGERRVLFERLMTGLLPQLDPYAGQVRVIGWFNNGSPPLPKIRQRMVETAGSEYISFVDDDDLVTPDYVAEIMAALDQRPDYVGFQVQCYSDGAPIGVAYHSLEFRRWRNFSGRFERDISHLNPIRRELALKASFAAARTGRAEDRVWADQLRRMRVLRKQAVVPRILYHYLYSTSRDVGLGSRWELPSRIVAQGERPAVTSPYFSWSPYA